MGLIMNIKLKYTAVGKHSIPITMYAKIRAALRVALLRSPANVMPVMDDISET